MSPVFCLSIFLHIAAKIIILKCKSDNITSLINILQNFLGTSWDKIQTLSMRLKALIRTCVSAQSCLTLCHSIDCSLGEGNGTHSSTLAWKIPWMEEPGGLQSMGSRRVGHDWATSLSLSCIGEGNGNPLQCSCLENPRGGGAWWAAVYGVAQSPTRLKRLSSRL